MKHTSSRLRIIAALIITSFIAITPAAKAAEGDGKTVPVEVKCIGFKNNSPVYQVSFNNEKEEEFTLQLRDNSGNLLYSEKLKGTNMSRKFQLVNEGTVDEDISFEVINRKTNSSVKYRTSNNTELVSNASVVKVK